MLNNYIDQILFASKFHPERVADVVSDLRADPRATAQLDKLVSILGIGGDVRIEQLTRENDTYKRIIAELKAQQGAPSGDKPVSASTSRLQKAVAASKLKVEKLEDVIVDLKLDIKDLKADLKEAVAANGEFTSKKVASAAAKVLNDPDSSPEARTIAASALTQARNK